MSFATRQQISSGIPYVVGVSTVVAPSTSSVTLNVPVNSLAGDLAIVFISTKSQGGYSLSGWSTEWWVRGFVPSDAPEQTCLYRTLPTGFSSSYTFSGGPVVDILATMITVRRYKVSGLQDASSKNPGGATTSQSVSSPFTSTKSGLLIGAITYQRPTSFPFVVTDPVNSTRLSYDDGSFTYNYKPLLVVARNLPGSTSFFSSTNSAVAYCGGAFVVT